MVIHFVLSVLQDAHAAKLVKVKDILCRFRGATRVRVEFLDGTVLSRTKRVTASVSKGDILTLHGKHDALTIKSEP